MKWLPPLIRQPYVFFSLLILLLVEFVRNALILSLLPNIGLLMLNLTPATVGLAISAHYFFDNILRTPMGFLTDHFGQRWMLSIGMLFASAGMIVMADATSALTLTGGAALFGIGTSPLWPCVISTVTSSSKEEEKASAMGYIYIAWLIGGGAGPVLINFIYVFSYHTAFTLLVTVLVCCGFVIAVIRPAHEVHANWGSKVYVFAPRRYLREIVVHLKEIRVLFLGMFVQTFAIGVLIPVLTPYARVVLHVSPQMQSLAMVGVGGTTVLLLPVMGKLVDRLGARPFLSIGFLLTSTTLVLFAMQKSFWPAIFFLLLLGISYSMILPSWNSVLDRSIDSKKRGAMWGLFMTIEGFGTATGPIIGGRMWEAAGPQSPFILSAVVVGAMGLLYIFLRIPSLKKDWQPQA